MRDGDGEHFKDNKADESECNSYHGCAFFQVRGEVAKEQRYQEARDGELVAANKNINDILRDQV